MIRFLELTPAQFPPTPDTGQYAQGNTLPLRNNLALVLGTDKQISLKRSESQTALGILPYGNITYRFDPANTERLILCNTTEVWEIDLQNATARKIIAGGLPLSCALPVPGAILTLISRPWAAVQRWSSDPSGVFFKEWQIEVPQQTELMSDFADGAGLVLHDRYGDEMASRFVAHDKQGLRGVCGCETKIEGVLTNEGKTYIKLNPAGMSWWYLLEGGNEAIQVALSTQPWPSLREVEVPLIDPRA